MFNRIRSSVVAFMLIAGLASCGGDNQLIIQSPETVIFDPSLGIDLASMTRSSTGLYTTSLVQGTGDGVTAGRTVKVGYTGFLTNGTVFEDRPPTTPFTFVLGNGSVIKGWDEGVLGMKVGEQRLLVIPPSLGYGNAPQGVIPAGSVLVFVVELVSFQ